MIHNEDDKVWVTVSRTISTGNYESFKIEAGQSYTVKPKENATQEMEDLMERVFESVLVKSKEYKKEFLPKKKKPRREEDDE